MARILIVRGHPDPQKGHFADALVEAYGRGAGEGGHEVVTLDVARLDIAFLRSDAQWRVPPASEDMRKAQDRITWAEHLVFIYPLWLGDMPALLKAFLEQVSCNGAVMSLDEKGHWKQGLKGKSARIFVTMGMPALAYRLFFLSHSLKSFERNILKFAGASPVRSSVIGSIESSAEHRAQWLAKAGELGRAAG